MHLSLNQLLATGPAISHATTKRERNSVSLGKFQSGFLLTCPGQRLLRLIKFHLKLILGFGGR